MRAKIARPPYFSMRSIFCGLWISTISLVVVGCADRGPLNNSSTAYVGGNTSATNREESISQESRAYWDGDSVSGSPSIVLNLTRQTIYFYKGGQLVGMSPVSTGREGYDTPTGLSG